MSQSERRFGLHYDQAHRHHDVPEHPEAPERIDAVLAALASGGFMDRVAPIAERVATDTELRLVHDQRLITWLTRAEAAGGAQVDSDTAVVEGSVDAARRAVGGVLNAVDAVLGDTLAGAFCLDRPPGHHATPTQAMGFCLFNQVAIGARYAQRVHGLARVAIIDFDVHHGNGTQDAFAADQSVLYCSSHEYPFYPGSGHWRERGAGNLVNIPLPAGCGDAEYAAAFREVITPAVDRFRPELILVSAGFDAHLADPLADMAVTEAGYAFLAGAIQALADAHTGGRSVWALEGGYRLAALARSVTAVLRVLLGDQPPPLIDASPRDDVARLLSAITGANVAQPE